MPVSRQQIAKKAFCRASQDENRKPDDGTQKQRKEKIIRSVQVSLDCTNSNDGRQCEPSPYDQGEHRHPFEERSIRSRKNCVARWVA